MLKSYKAVIKDGQIKWLTDEPNINKAHVIVTILEDTTLQPSRRTPATTIAGKGKTIGDLVSPIIDEQDWECLR